ncbi:ribose ABC transporter permease [Spirochaetia bacterium]|nr:ribose ABC transporter permease [Spirochaetia bacterium]
MRADGAVKRGIPQWLRGFIKTKGSLVVFLILWLFAMIFVPRFAMLDNALLIIKQAAIPVIACLGMTMVLMTGGIDLSLGYTVGLSSIIVGILVKGMGIPAVPAVLITLVTGCVIGLLNGFVVQVIRVPAFIATLGTGYIIYGLAQIVSQGRDINRLPRDFLAIGRTEFLGINTTVAIALGICLIMYYVIHMSTFGRGLSAFGYSARASKLSGIHTAQINITVYVVCALFASLAGILLTIRVNSAQPNMGGGNYTFEIITAAVVGGASLFGGVGSVIGSVFGVLIIKVIENCINLAGVSYYTYQAVQGLVILLSIIFENVKNRKL